MIIANSAMVALQKVQDEFKGEADRLGLKSEADVVNLVKRARQEVKMEKQGEK